MLALLLSLFIDSAEAHPSRHGHHHRPPVAARNHRPPPSHYYSQPVPRVGFRFIWNGFVWMEVPIHYSYVRWVPGHYDQWGYWIPGHYVSIR
jgi:hypothetical protein